MSTATVVWTSERGANTALQAAKMAAAARRQREAAERHAAWIKRHTDPECSGPDCRGC